MEKWTFEGHLRLGETHYHGYMESVLLSSLFLSDLVEFRDYLQLFDYD